MTPTRQERFEAIFAALGVPARRTLRTLGNDATWYVDPETALPLGSRMTLRFEDPETNVPTGGQVAPNIDAAQR